MDSKRGLVGRSNTDPFLTTCELYIYEIGGRDLQQRIVAAYNKHKELTGVEINVAYVPRVELLTPKWVGLVFTQPSPRLSPPLIAVGREVDK